VLDTGTFASDQNWATRIIALFVTLTGIFVAGSLIGLIANAIDQKVAELRKGRSVVIEEGHTIVLGWSPRLPVILTELVIANANHRDQAFVVLAPRAKEEMEDELHHLVPNGRTTRIVCRTGDPGDPRDLELVNVETARSVIALSGEEGDAGVVKAILAVRSVDPTLSKHSVVAELQSIDHANTLRMLTANRVATVQADDVISHVTARACRQAGLAGVFRDLLDFEGDEIYFARVPELTGHTYLDAVTAFESCSVIGVDRDGVVTLNPSADFTFADGDEVLVIATDDGSIVFTGVADRQPAQPVAPLALDDPPRNIVIIGWSSLGAGIIDEFDHFLHPGSTIDVIVDRTVLDPQDVVVPVEKFVAVRVHAVGAGPKPLVDLLRAGNYDLVIVLGYRTGMTADEADARSMLTLLALHTAWGDSSEAPRVVAEMLDRGNVNVARTTGVDDFIVSDELSSLMIAQLSQRIELDQVFGELFAVEGCGISLHPAALYAPGHGTTYGDIVARAALCGESAIGIRRGREPVWLNPPKSTAVELGPQDQVLVLGPRPPRAAAPVPTDTMLASAVADDLVTDAPAG
jgi:voltage-gated potassium channel Kch